METFNLVTSKNHEVPCISNSLKDGEDIVVIIHGFGSSKLSSTGMVLLDKLPSYGMAGIAFDFPGHGDSPDYGDDLRISRCMEHLATVETFLKDTCPKSHIKYFASSFGAYILLLYVSTHKYLGEKALLRSAAVNMPSLFTDISDEAIKDFSDKGYTVLENELRDLKISGGFLEDLSQNSVFKKFTKEMLLANFDGLHEKPYTLEIKMLHARDDETIDYNQALRFSEEKNISLKTFENENHRLLKNQATQNEVVKLAITFLKG